MKKEKVAIILVNWNNPLDTIECIKSLCSLNYDNFKIYIVDNGSSDNSVLEISKYLATTSIEQKFIESEENLGFSGGNNLAIQEAMKDGISWFWLLNNDTIADKNSLDHLMKYAVERHYAGILGSKIYYYNTKNIWFAGGNINRKTGKGSSIGRNEEDTGQFDDVSTCDYITGCSLLIKKEVIESIGLLEDGFFLYYEDTDWCLRARLSGWDCLYIPQSVIEHKVGASTEEGYSSPFLTYYNLRNRFIMTKRNKGYFSRTGPLLFLLRMGIASIYFAIIRKDRKIERIRYALLGMFDGLFSKLGKHK